jgi:hypothetical protein
MPAVRLAELIAPYRAAVLPRRLSGYEHGLTAEALTALLAPHHVADRRQRVIRLEPERAVPPHQRRRDDALSR